MPSWPRGVTLIGVLLLIDGSGLSILLVRAVESAVIPVGGGYVSGWMGPPSPSLNSLLHRCSSAGLSASAVRAGAKRLSSWIEFDRRGLLRNFLKGLCIVGSPSWSYHARFLAALLYRSTSKIRKGGTESDGWKLLTHAVKRISSSWLCDVSVQYLRAGLFVYIVYMLYDRKPQRVGNPAPRQ